MSIGETRPSEPFIPSRTTSSRSLQEQVPHSQPIDGICSYRRQNSRSTSSGPAMMQQHRLGKACSAHTTLMPRQWVQQDATCSCTTKPRTATHGTTDARMDITWDRRCTTTAVTKSLANNREQYGLAMQSNSAIITSPNQRYHSKTNCSLPYKQYTMHSPTRRPQLTS